MLKPIETKVFIEYFGFSALVKIRVINTNVYHKFI